MILPFCVYVLQSQKDLLLYHGFTTNLEKRIKNHNSGGTISTSKRRPLKLIYCEFFLSKEDASRRESYFKTTVGKRMLKLVLRDTLTKIDYPRLWVYCREVERSSLHDCKVSYAQYTLHRRELNACPEFTSGKRSETILYIFDIECFWFYRVLFHPIFYKI